MHWRRSFSRLVIVSKFLILYLSSFHWCILSIHATHGFHRCLLLASWYTLDWSGSLFFFVKLLCLVKNSFPLFCFVWLINCSLCAKNNKTHNKPPWVIATWLLPNVWCIWVAAILNYHQIYDKHDAEQYFLFKIKLV